MVRVSLCQKIAPFLPRASKPDLCQEFNNQVRFLAGPGASWTAVSEGKPPGGRDFALLFLPYLRNFSCKSLAWTLFALSALSDR